MRLNKNNKNKDNKLFKKLATHQMIKLILNEKYVTNKYKPAAEPYYNNNEVIEIVYHSDDIDKLTYIEDKSDWIDLHSAEKVELKAGDFKIIPLGVSMKLPKGYEAHIVPRSSTFKKWGIIQTNHIGIIDNTYCGNDDVWGMPVYATRDTTIEVNDRICQFRIMRNQPRLIFNKVEKLENKSRGGFGSTGV